MKKLLLSLIILTSINCKGQSNPEPDLAQLIERDQRELNRITEEEKSKGSILDLNILDLEFGQSSKTVDSILKQKSDFESINTSTHEFENYGINWKFTDFEVPTLIRVNHHKDKLHELELVFITDEKNIELGFEKLIEFLRKKYGNEHLKLYSVLSKTKENGPFTHYWIEKNRKIMAYKMKEYCYLRITDSSINHDMSTTIFGNNK
ncbi:MAG: hypothetical protein CMO82_10755 [Winogradskyella sp.]|mgnify:CR=1 FL=1|uniref:Lipoprotein n=1 Tax=Winogradskyella poriferorum TaxID=307627 RepID=A0ABU7WAH4_9FLAO|nr:hypothetical protein [Winogradskyella sp.]|tara:strand:- start:13708 stop:14325 length:618 start_codon:yes stop_codon:yes gene_type:complete